MEQIRKPHNNKYNFIEYKGDTIMAYTGTILVTTDALNDKADNFQNKANDVKGLHDEMLNLIRNLMNSWDSDGAQAYSVKFNNLSTSMDTINRMIMEHVTDLKAMAANYAESETAAVSEIDSLPTATL